MSFFGRLRNWLFSREMLVTIFVLIVVWLIWEDFALIAIGNAHPFESPEARGWLIAAVLLTWAVWLCWRLGWIVAFARACGRTRAKWVERAELVRQRRVPLGETEKRLREALAVLRRRTRAGGKRWRGWLDRLTGHYVYALPWYALLGPDGAGKTSFIREAGLVQPEGAARNHAPVEDCSWWFGNRCVLVDVPGSWLSRHDGTAGPLPLMRLLRRHRADQPVNGVILTLPVDDLMHASESHILESIARHRSRLQGMQEDAGIVLPVYLVVTKTDRLTGFAEYFDSLSADERTQVWGWTCPAEADDRSADALQAGLAALLDRLNDGLADTLAREPDVRRRQDIYLFPQQFAALKARVGLWYGELSRYSQYETNLAVRGVYFTSARHGGEPVDPVLAERRARLGVADTAGLPAMAPRHGSTFLARLLPDVLLEESAWAGKNRAQTAKRMMMHGGALLVSGLALAALAALWTNSYLSNRAFLRDVALHTAELDRYGKAPLDVPPGDVAALAPLLEMENALPLSPAIDTGAPSMLEDGMGLYQGARVLDASGDLYRRTLREKLLPVVAVRIHDILAGAPPPDPEFTYDALKAYLMLYEQKAYDPDFLAAWLQLNVNRALPVNTTKEMRSMIDGQLSDLVALGPLASPFPIDTTLVSTVRGRLLQMPFAQRTYHYLRRKELESIQLPPISIASAGGPEASLVLTRKSGRPITEGVPALFTATGYWDHINKDIDSAVDQIHREDHWVLGVPVDSAERQDNASRRQLIDAVKRQYFGDFIQTWDDYLGDVKIVGSQSLVQSMQIARTLSSLDSPLKLFFTAVAKQTDLLDGHGAASVRRDGGRIAQRIGEARKSLAQMFGDASSPAESRSGERPESIVDDHFASLRHLVLTGDANNKGPVPIDDVLKIIDGLYQYLVSVNGAVDSGNPPPSTDVFNRLKAEAGRMPPQMQGLVNEVSKTGESQVNGMMQRDLRKNAYSSVGAVCAQTIAGRYPFARTSTHDVASSDFSRMFSPGGLMDDFYQKNLTHGTTTSADTASFNSDPGGGFAASFRNAAIVRNVFFAGNAPSMSYGFSVAPADLDPGISEFVLDVGGQTMRYAHGPQIPVNMQWPGSRSEVVSLQVVTPSGTSGIRTQGPWALQHLFDKAAIVPGSNGDGFVATFTVDGRKLSLAIRSNSAYDPFFLPQMKAFACPS